MSTQLVVLVCFLALVLLLGVVSVVALVRADREDIPTVFGLFTRGFRRLVKAVPQLPGSDETQGVDAADPNSSTETSLVSEPPLESLPPSGDDHAAEQHAEAPEKDVVR